MTTYRIKKREIEFKICCFCGNDRWNLSVSIKKGCYHCWVCGAKGSNRKLQILLPGLSMLKPEEWKEQDEKKIVAIQLQLEGMLSFIGTEGEQYLKERGVSREEGLRWKIQYIKKRELLVVPYYAGEQLIYYTGKNIRTERWTLPDGIDKKEIVWVNTISPISNDIILVEGIFDAMRVVESKLNVMVLLGTKVFSKQLGYINRCKLNPVLFLDSDVKNETYKNIEKTLDRFAYMECPVGKDPDDLTKEQIVQLYTDKKIYGLSIELRKRLLR